MCRLIRVASALLTAACVPLSVAAQTRSSSDDRNLARDIFRELIERDTSEPAGDPGSASEAMAKRLRAAGFAADDVRVFGAESRLRNLVVRLRGRNPGEPP